MSEPRNRIVPLVAGSVPASTARKVDLPAPLGPISPVIWPGGISRETPSTARIPSKCRCTSVAVRIGSEATSGLAELEARGVDVLGLGRHALGTEPEEADDQEPDADPLKRRHQTDLRCDGKGTERELAGNE